MQDKKRWITASFRAKLDLRRKKGAVAGGAPARAARLTCGREDSVFPANRSTPGNLSLNFRGITFTVALAQFPVTVVPKLTAEPSLVFKKACQ